MSDSRKVFKLSIKTSHEDGYDPFSVCRDEEVVGIGWSYIFKEREGMSVNDSLPALADSDPEMSGASQKGELPSAVRRFVQDVSAGDFFWIHRKGGYFLCEVQAGDLASGPAIRPVDFGQLDLGYLRRARWTQIPAELVSGRVQRQTIAPTTLKRIPSTAEEIATFEFLAGKLRQDETWRPSALSEREKVEVLSGISNQELARLLSPDDHEDLVASYLQQERGWTLVKSTCFRSKPKYEFTMVREGPSCLDVQVKSGQVYLDAGDATYREDAGSDRAIFLYSTHQECWSAQDSNGVERANPEVLLNWLRKRTWAVPALGLQLAVLAERRSGPAG